MAGLGPNHRVSGDSLRSHFQVIIRGASLYRLEDDAYRRAGLRLMHAHECIWSPFSQRDLLSYRPTMRNVHALNLLFVLISIEIPKALGTLPALR